MHMPTDGNKYKKELLHPLELIDHENEYKTMLPSIGLHVYSNPDKPWAFPITTQQMQTK